MFIKAIVVRGYQSLYKVGLELGAFSVVYGESDVGKSGLYRAIRALITTEQGDSFISKGEKKCGVALQLSSGDKIVWLKEKGKTCEYQLNEQCWRRSRSLPVEIVQKLKIFPIVVNGDSFYPNLRGQFDSLFLLFESSAKRARVLGSLISNILLQGIRQANIERNRGSAEIRVLEDLISKLEKRESFDWETLLKEIREVEESLQKVERGLKLYEEVQELLKKRSLYLRLEKFDVKFLPKKFFSDLEKLLQIYEGVTEQRDVLFSKKEEVAFLEREEVSCSDNLAKLKKELSELRKKLNIVCPFCKKEFSVLEVLR